jgi:spore maturation protein CgeB
MPLRIAFFGSSLVSAYWNGAATYYRGLCRALAARGHRITFYEPDAYDRQAHRDIDDPPWAEVVVYPATEPGVLSALTRAEGADVLIKASGVGVFDELLEAAVLRARRRGTLVVYCDVDAPATLERVRLDARDAFRPLIPEYDLIITYGGGDPIVAAYRALGARRCVPIYNALDPETHFPTAPDPRFACDLAFLGNRLPDREARVDEFFLKAAARLPGRRLLLGGNGWGERNLPANVTYLGHVYTRDHNALNSTAHAVLNIHRDSMVANGWSPATRFFEAAGAGACMITDAWRGIELFLEPDAEVLVAASGAEVAEQVAGLDPARARRIGDAARRRILAAHTYAHRALLLEALLEGRDADQTVGAA